MLAASGPAQSAAPAAQTFVRNQADATYRDAQGAPMPRVRSNTVEAQVQQVGGFTLASSQSRPGAPGQPVYFSHILTNTGNGTDDFRLSVADGAVDGFAFADAALYPDADGNGLPDRLVPVASTGALPPGASYRFVAAARVPTTAAPGQQGRLTVTAQGTAGESVAPAQTNIDTAVISSNAVVVASKALDVSSGPSPFSNGGEHVRVTITYTNVGNASASRLQVNDTIGGVGSGFDTMGMLYVPGSARWNNLPLTDIAGSDPGGVDFHARLDGTTAKLSLAVPSLGAGTSQTLSFLVDIGAGLPAGNARTRNVARLVYFDGAADRDVTTNIAAYEVIPAPTAADLVLAKTAQTPTFTTGFEGRYTLTVRNRGDAPTRGVVTVTDPLPAGLNFVTQGSGGTGWACGANGRTVVCNTDQTIAARGEASPLTLVVAVSEPAAAAPQPLSNTATVSGGGEPAANAGNNTGTAQVTVGPSASVAGRVWLDSDHNRRYDAGEPLLDGWRVEVLRKVDGQIVLVKWAMSGSAGGPGTYRIDGLEAGEGYIVRFIDPSSGILFGNPVDGDPGSPVSGAQIGGGWLYDIVLQPGQSVVDQSLPLDPSGVVYDSQTRQPVRGATVTIAGPAGFDSSIHLLGGKDNESQVTGDGGFYQFLLNSGAPSGVYELKVTAPGGYLPFSPAGLLSAAPTLGCAASFEHCLDPTGRGNGMNVLEVQPQTMAPAEGQSHTYYLRFDLAPGDPDVVNNHIPLDPLPPTTLSIRKAASRATVELGDFVDYTVELRNTSTVPIPGAVTLTDRLPAGFTYQPGSARRDGQPLPDPVGAEGRALRFDNLPALGAREGYKVTYRVRVGVGALQGDGINRARAIAGKLASMMAQAKVEVQGGVFSDKGFIVGKVYLECNRDRVQNAEEIGIPGVRVYLEDGTFAVSDSEGKYSFYGVSPRTHVLKLDMSSMPVGSELIVLGNRNAGDPGSRFVDLKNGELHKANFAEGSCTPEILRQVQARRDKGGVFVAETDRQLEARIAANGRAPTTGDPRALPAAGLVGGDRAIPSFKPVLPDEPAAPAGADAKRPEPPVRAAPAADLDALMRELDNTLDFVGLQDGDTLPYAQATVQVKGRAGMAFALVVNGEELAAGRVGRKAVLAERQLEVWEYVGVDLRPGRNTLEAVARDPFGNVRATRAITLVAPDRLGRLRLGLPRDPPVADGHTPARIEVELSDAAGVPVTVRTPVTLEASLGRWDVKDLDPREPGVQVFVEGGRAEFALLPPQEPGEAQIRILSGLLKAEERLAFVPELRPLIASGVIEGVLNLRNLSGGSLVPARADDGFEQELRHFSRRSGDGKSDAGARAAFFLKGKVKGEYLLTMAYDSDKDTRERLFRDIQPDQFYPVYGDSSIKGFDAQSTSRLYVRVDHDKSYLLWGDYTTATVGQARQLGNYSRSLSGVKEHYESGRVAANAFASHDSSRQVVEELPARGISGPYVISARDILGNSEKVEILTRDRNQPGVILKVVPLARFTDYDFEPQTGRLLFRAPIPTLDGDFNPNSIRVTYEVDQGGEKFWVYGADVQAQVSGRVEVGGSYVKDENPLDRTELRSVNATVQLAQKTFLTGEAAQIERDTTGEGDARRVELRHEGERVQARLYAGRTDTAFNNAASPLSNGREESGAKVALRVGPSTAIKAEAIRNGDARNSAEREGVLASVEHSFGSGIKAEVGARHAVETSATAQNEVDSARVKLTGQVSSHLSLFGEYEQDVKDSDRRIAAVGGDYQLANRSRLYGRYEFISTLGSTYALTESTQRSATVFGIDTDYMRDGRLFSEYRLRDALAGREAEAALGLRNKWQVAEGLSLNTNFERIHSVEGVGANESLALGGGVEYTASPRWKGNARIEYRDGSTSDQWLLSLGLANKLSRDWTFLGREIYSLQSNGGGRDSRQLAQRLQLGLAYRDTDTDRINALGRIEHRIEKDDSNPLLPLEQEAVILSSHVNVQYSKPLTVSGRVAAKWLTDRSNGLSSRSRLQAVGTRLTYDIDWKWDAGLHASVLHDGEGTYHAGLGLELGYRVATNLWVSGGYNLFGYKEPDLSGSDYTARGFYLRMRFKFDEHLFSGKDPTVNSALPPQVQKEVP